jgi:hypothetical protein
VCSFGAAGGEDESLRFMNGMKDLRAEEVRLEFGALCSGVLDTGADPTLLAGLGFLTGLGFFTGLGFESAVFSIDVRPSGRP